MFNKTGNAMFAKESVADTTTKNKKYRLVPNGPDADNYQLFQFTHMDAAIEIDSLKDLISKMHCFVYDNTPYMRNTIDSTLSQLNQMQQELNKMADQHYKESDIYVMEEV
jgi:hypothetical protein